VLTIEPALEASRLQRENLRLRQYSQPSPEISGRSEVMSRLREQLKRIANHNTPVLIDGESGTDKESVARYLHAQSNRADGPFIKVSVSTLSPDDAGVELFGRVVNGDVIPGYLDRAQGGTLFLKDIADMDAATQAKLQSALEKQSYTRRGSPDPVPLDVRLVAATRYRLDELVKEGKFRDDLYFQISVVPVRVPPLREHYEDVPELLEHYVNYFVEQEGLPYRRFSTAAQNRLRRYSWPGNVRELRNLVQRLLILGSSESIELEEVEAALGQQPGTGEGEDVRNFDLPLREARAQIGRASCRE